MIRHPVRHAAVFLVTAVLGFGGSCVSDGGGESPGTSGSGGYNPGGYNSGGYNNGGGYDADDRSDRTSPDRPNRIPRWADVVREGTGKLRWTADLDGTVYVYDRDHDVVRYAGPVRRGDEVTVRPGDDQVAVADRVVSTDDLKRDAFHQLFFAVDRNGGTSERQSDRPTDRPTDRPRRDASPPTPPAAPVVPPAVAPAAAPAAVGDLPAGAQSLASGGDVVAIAKAPHAGTVYVYDETSRAVVFQSPLKKGAAFQVVPREGMTYVNGDPLKRVRLAKGHTLTLYFVTR